MASSSSLSKSWCGQSLDNYTLDLSTCCELSWLFTRLGLGEKGKVPRISPDNDDDLDDAHTHTHISHVPNLGHCYNFRNDVSLRWRLARPACMEWMSDWKILIDHICKLTRAFVWADVVAWRLPIVANPDMTEWDLCLQRYFRTGSRFVGSIEEWQNSKLKFLETDFLIMERINSCSWNI